MRLTYANVTSTLALFIALGGVGYAAVKLPRNSVGTKQIKAKSVTLAKVAPKARAALRGRVGPTGPAGNDGAAGTPGTAGAQGERGPTGPAGPLTETERKVKLYAYRFEPGVARDYDFGDLRMRAASGGGYTLCRTGSTAGPRTIHSIVSGNASSQTIGDGNECWNGSFSPPTSVAYTHTGLGARLELIPDAAGDSWELVGYDVVQ